MKKPTRKWTLDIIHHSHTDIGYTERQEKIERFHVHFIKQVLQILSSIKSGEKSNWEGFKWTCETFWPVERFLAQATDDEAQVFQAYVRSGDISLSGTYLNMTELIDADLLARMIKRSTNYANSIGVTLDSAMTADINGYSWGFAQCLLDAGIHNLLSCIHTHHGMFPLGQKQTPFWWEAPSGKRLLVWNGDHYNLGNDLGLALNALHSYIIRDEFHTPPFVNNHWEVMEARIMRYLSQLEEEGYPYDFAPVALSGIIVDNAPPNGSIIDLFHQWNEVHGDVVTIQMTTLSDLFAKLRQQTDIEIPVYRGDWPDWWSDGVASTAAHTQLFRDAQRNFQLLVQLDPENSIIPKAAVREMEEQLTLYAEHTWGYSHSITEPWNPMVQSLGARKEAYAANASRLVHTAIDAVLEAKGEAMLAPGRSMRYKVINPFQHDIRVIAKMYLDYWELPLIRDGFEVREEGRTDVVMVHQVSQVSRGTEVSILITLKAAEERTFRLIPDSAENGETTSSFALTGSDRVKDIRDFRSEDQPFCVTQNSVESAHVLISWEAGKGIVSWIDKRSEINLIDITAPHSAFAPVYEVTPVKDHSLIRKTRTKMGRNRKGMNVQRHVGQLVHALEVERGPLWITIEQEYESVGMSHYVVRLTVYAHEPRVDVAIRLHKDSVWEPENVYIPLPFSLPNAQLWLEKAGALMRPGIDQIPGTGLDFYSIQNGLGWIGQEQGLAIAMPDTPLVQLGPLAFGDRLLQGQQDRNEVRAIYSWILNNFWETNFKATLGGFYEFRYSVYWGNDLNTPEKAIAQCRLSNQRVINYRAW